MIIKTLVIEKDKIWRRKVEWIVYLDDLYENKIQLHYLCALVKGTRSGSWFLKREVMEEIFFKDSELALKHSYGQKNHKPVFNYGKYHIRESPTLPAVSFAVSCFFRRLISPVSPECELVKYVSNYNYTRFVLFILSLIIINNQ